VHAALTHALACTRRWPWLLQLDVAHCFPSIPHAPLLALVRRRLRGSAFDLLAHIVGGHAASPGHGLPIGSLTSQHLANQYLGELDRAAIAHPATRAHVRYMDDVVLWCDSAADARALRDHLVDWLPRTLGLQFKPPLNPAQRPRPDVRRLPPAAGRIAVGPAPSARLATALAGAAGGRGSRLRGMRPGCSSGPRCCARWRCRPVARSAPGARAVMAGPPAAGGAAADAADDRAPGPRPGRCILDPGRAPKRRWGPASGCCAAAAGTTTAGNCRSANRNANEPDDRNGRHRASAWPERWPSAMLSKAQGCGQPRGGRLPPRAKRGRSGAVVGSVWMAAAEPPPGHSFRWSTPPSRRSRRRHPITLKPTMAANTPPWHPLPPALPQRWACAWGEDEHACGRRSSSPACAR
jgi:hypothetical protein